MWLKYEATSRKSSVQQRVALNWNLSRRQQKIVEKNCRIRHIAKAQETKYWNN